MVLNFLRLLFGRTVVNTRDLSLVETFLMEHLKEHGFTDTDRIPESVRTLLLEEALRRAAEKEKDGQPRSSEFLKQTELVGNAVIAAFNADANADHRVKNILVFHKVL